MSKLLKHVARCHVDIAVFEKSSVMALDFLNFARAPSVAKHAPKMELTIRVLGEDSLSGAVGKSDQFRSRVEVEFSDKSKLTFDARQRAPTVIKEMKDHVLRQDLN